MKPNVIRQPDGTPGDTRTLLHLLPTRLADVAEAEALARTASQSDKIQQAAVAAAQTAAQQPNACDPKVCSQDSVSIRRNTLARHRQPLIYGSAEHTSEPSRFSCRLLVGGVAGR